MTKTYLILVDGKLASRRHTFVMALKDKKELESKGYQKVAVAQALVLGGN